MRPFYKLIIMLFFLSLSLYAESETEMEVVIQNCHTKMINTIVYSPDGRFIASGSDDCTVKLWTFDGKLLKTMTAHTNNVTSVVFSPDSRMIASSAEDGIRLWDLYGNLLNTFGDDSLRTNALEFTPDGKYFISTGSYTVIWDIKQGLGKKIEIRYGAELAVNKDGSIFAISSPEWVGIWTINGSLLFKIKFDDSVIKDLAFNPKEDRLAGVTWSGRVFIWDKELKPVQQFDLGKNLVPSTIVFAPDGKSLYINGSWDNFIRVRKFSIDGKPIRNFPGMGNIVNTFAVSPDERYITGAGYDMKIYDTAADIVSFFDRISGDPNHLTFGPNGDIFASEHWDQIRLWSTDGRLITAFDVFADSIQSIAFCPDGNTIAGGSTTGLIYLWNTNGELLHKLKGHTRQKPADFPMVNTLAFHPGGDVLLSGGNDMTVRIWDKNGNPLKTFSDHTDTVTAVAWSPDGKLIASGSQDGTIRFRDIDGNPKGLIKESGSIKNLSFIFDNNHILCNTGLEIHIRDISGNLEWTYKAGDKFVKTIAVNKDSSLIAVGYLDGTIVFFSPEGTIIKTLTDNKSGRMVTSLAFNPANNQIVSGSTDSTIKIWDIETSLYVSLLAKGREWLNFTPDGYFDASKNGGSFVSMVRGTTAYGIDQFALFKNRPDILLKRAGSKDTPLIEHFFNQYIKRLAKSGALPRYIDEGSFSRLEKKEKGKNTKELLLACYQKSGKQYRLKDACPLVSRYALLAVPAFLSFVEEGMGVSGSLPDARISNVHRDGYFVDIDFVFTDKNHKLERCNIYANDVPLFGREGKQIAGNEYKGKERVELINGTNKIEVSCVNELLTESYRDYTIVPCEKKGFTDLYFIGFGVSEYKDSSLNLLYPHKDVADLARLFRHMNNPNITGRFNQVHVKTITDSECTVKNIKIMHDFLLKSDVDDTVVILISGHGIHGDDEMSTYYYLTHEADIANLTQTAASFDLIESILDHIKPRKKLFLMDTCESGEIDEELAVSYLKTAGTKGLAARTIKKKTPLDKGLRSQKKRSFLLKQDRYISNDLFRRTGTIVFSSSKGDEFSYEPVLYQKNENGFFTKAVIESLMDSSAEKNNDQMRSIDEIRDYVNGIVSVRTHGLQNPTIDRDNIYQKIDFPPVWWLKDVFYVDDVE